MEYSFKKTSLTLLTLIFVAIWGVTPVYAATLIVTNLNDSGAGSLRAAITSAAAGDTISFATGLSGGTINLASTLILTKNVTINGSMLAMPITISGDTTPADGIADVRVFRVSSAVTATLDSLVITKGKFSGIYNDGTLTVINSKLSGNSADSGGAIYNNGNLALMNSIISGNSASHGGGGIYNNNLDDDYLTVTNSTISGNSVSDSSYSGGGGIENIGGKLTITNSTLSDNSSALNGGGIESNGKMTITNSTLSGNSASGSGGAIANYGNPITITKSTLSDNSASHGGGIDNNAGRVIVRSSTLFGNSASDDEGGGGIYNSSDTYNGYIITYAELIVTNSTLSGNSAVIGGGIVNYLGKMTITNSTLFGNTAPTSGGIYSRLKGSDDIFTLINTIIAGSPSGGDCNGKVTASSRNNLVQDGSCSATLNGAPYLGALANNGGLTKTFALLTGSPAIDAGDDTICAAAQVNNLDQRGNARPVGAHCDIGAYEGEIVLAMLTLKSIAAQDGWVLESSETSNAGGSAYSIGPALAIGDNAAKQEYRSILSFNTSSLPDTAVISGVTLKVKKKAIIGGDDPFTVLQGLMVGMSNGTIGAAALENGDFQAPVGTLVAFGPFIPIPVNNWYSIDLSNGKAYINKLASNSGLTQIRLRFKLDDNNDAIANYLSLYSGNTPIAADRPQLVIYYVP